MTTGSTRKLLDLVEREQMTLVFGQDGKIPQTIKKVPAYFE